MLIVIDGRIGSGKSYYAVNLILNKYCKYNVETMRWEKANDDVEIISNIDNFYVSQPLEKYIENAGSLQRLFSLDYQKMLVSTTQKKHVYIIDEAQQSKFFHYKFYDPDVFYVFEYARHIGLEFILITQDITKLSKGLASLPEYIVRAQRQSMLLLRSMFVYHYLCGTDIYAKKRLKKSAKVFTAYRSQMVGIMKQKSFVFKYVIHLLLLVFVTVGGIVYFSTTRFNSIFNQKKVSSRPAVPSLPVKSSFQFSMQFPNDKL